MRNYTHSQMMLVANSFIIFHPEWKLETQLPAEKVFLT